MKTRTLIVLAVIVAALAAGALAIRADSGGVVADWFRSLHGGGH